MAEKMTTTTRAVLGIIVSVIMIGTVVWSVATAVGAKAQIDQTQTKRIERTEESLNVHETRIDKAELNAERLVGINNSISGSLSRIESAQTKQGSAQMQLVEDMATVKAKVENLERSP